MVENNSFEIPKQQKAWTLHRLGGSTSDFKQETIDTPELTNPLDVLIKNYAISLNPTDVKSRTAEKKQLDEPKILGRDGSGVVVKVGKDVKNFQVGDEVWYAGTVIRQGSYQQYTLVDSRIISKKPTSLSHLEAASLPLTSLTVWEGCYENFRLHDPDNVKDKRVLVTAAAGGVGSIGIQLLKHWGLHVTATASRDETVSWVKKLGADDTINHHEPFAKQIEDKSKHFHYVLNAHKDVLLPEIVSVTKARGQITMILAIESGADKLGTMWNSVFTKRITMHFELMYSRTIYKYEEEVQGQILQQVARLVDDGAIRHTANKVWEWDEMIEAQNVLESGKSIGKNVVKVPQ